MGNKNNINKSNYIIGQIEIKKEDITKDIRIINSYEEYKEKEYYLESEKLLKMKMK